MAKKKTVKLPLKGYDRFKKHFGFRQGFFSFISQWQYYFPEPDSLSDDELKMLDQLMAVYTFLYPQTKREDSEVADNLTKKFNENADPVNAVPDPKLS